MKFVVEVRDVYGNRTVYPVCEKAKLFADLAGTKTLTHHAVIVIRKLGYTIEIKQKEVTL
jgi:hypothetical protein